MLSLKKQAMKLEQSELDKGHLVKVAELERNSVEIRYSKHILHIKCMIKKAMARNKVR